MKKIFLFLALIPFLANAQRGDVKLAAMQYKYSYVGTSTDVVDAAENLDKVFFINKSDMYFVTIQIDADTNTGCAGNVSFTVAGSYDYTNYTTIGTAVTWGTTADTVFTISNKTLTITDATTIAAHTEIAKGTVTAAQHTIVTAAATDYVNGTLRGYDTLYVNEGISDFVKDDTITVSQKTATVGAVASTRADTITVAAQTITSTLTQTQPGCDYDYIRVRVTGATASADIDLAGIEIKITKVP
jgi:hypothetical protein